MKDDILIGDTPKAKNRRGRIKDVKTSGRLWKHARLHDVYGLVTQEQIESYFVFTIVRNPWDRMVSYFHWLKVQNFDHPAVKIAQAHDFTGFLSDPTILRGLQNDATRNYVSDRDGVNRCDMSLRMENLSQDAQKLGQHIGVKLAGLPHENPSQRDLDYTGYYNADTKSIIAAVFAEDIQKFNYGF